MKKKIINREVILTILLALSIIISNVGSGYIVYAENNNEEKLEIEIKDDVKDEKEGEDEDKKELEDITDSNEKEKEEVVEKEIDKKEENEEKKDLKEKTIKEKSENSTTKIEKRNLLARSGRSRLDLITELTVDNPNVQDGHSMLFTLAFDEDNKDKIVNGDYIEIDLPSEADRYGLNLYTIEDVLTVNGKPFANVSLNGGKIMIRFNENAESHNHVKGHINFRVIAKNYVDTNEENTQNVIIDVGNVPSLSINITKPETSTGVGEDGPGTFYYKTGDMGYIDTNHIRWFLNANLTKSELAGSNGIKIKDKIGSGQKLVRDSFDITISDLNNNYRYLNLEEFESEGYGTIKIFNDREFEININHDKAVYNSFVFNYRTRITRDGRNQESFDNESQAWYETHDGIFKANGDSFPYSVENVFLGGGIEGDYTDESSVKLFKVDGGTEEPLEGAEFDLYRWKEDGNDEKININPLITDSEGVIEYEDLEPGKYYFQETKAPKGYEIRDGRVAFELEEEENRHVKAFNYKKKAKLKISKVDLKTREKLVGARFVILNEANEKVKELDLIDKSEMEINLAAGKYKVKEVKAPDNYMVDPDIVEIDVYLNEDGDCQIDTIYKDEKYSKVKELEFENSKKEADKGGFRIRKTSSKKDANEEYIGLPLALFEVFDINRNLIGTIVTDSDGYGYMDELELGEYILKEKIAPEGYIKSDEEIKINVNTTNGELLKNIDKIIENDPKPKKEKKPIKIKKIDKDDETLELRDAIFSIRKKLNDEIITVVGTNSYGEIDINLPKGEYIVKEIIAPEGYIKSDEEQILIVDDENESYLLVFKNEKGETVEKKKGSIRILKVDSNDENMFLENAKFGLYKDGEKIKDVLTDKDGAAIIEDLEIGEYILKEEKAPKGYKLLEKDIKVLVEDSDKLEVLIIKNEKELNPLRPTKPIDPKDPDEKERPTRPVDPKDPDEKERPTRPVDPKDPDEKERPTRPVDPKDPDEKERPIKPIDPKDPDEKEEPTDLNDLEDKDKPLEIDDKEIEDSEKKEYIKGIYDREKEDVVSVLEVHTDDINDVKGVSDIKTENISGDALPQTGEVRNYYIYVIGALFILLGLFIRKDKKS